MPSSQTDRRLFRAPRAIFWTALAVRLACIVIGHTYRVRLNDNHFDFGFEAGRIAKSLVEGHGYGNPFNGPSGPTAWLPPAWPLLMALAFKLFGVYTRGAAFFLMALDSVFSSAVAVMVYEVAARCFDAQGIARRNAKKAAPVALWSAWLWALHPQAIQYPIHWLWEMSLTTMLFTAALVLALRMRRIGEHAQQPATGTFAQWLAMGLLWGLIALSNASLLLMFPAMAIWILWPRRTRSGREPIATRGIAGAALAVVVFFAVLTPWALRNQRAMHAFILTRDNFGVELWQSSLFYHEYFNWGTAMPLSPDDPEFRHYVAVGEVAYAHEKQQLAIENLRAHPDLFIRYTLDRAEFFWLGLPRGTDKHPGQAAGRIANFAFLSAAGILGLLLALRRRVPGAWLLAAAFLLVPLVYYAVTVQARFRHPIEPLIAVLGVYLFRSAETDRAFSLGRPKRHA